MSFLSGWPCLTSSPQPHPFRTLCPCHYWGKVRSSFRIKGLCYIFLCPQVSGVTPWPSLTGAPWCWPRSPVSRRTGRTRTWRPSPGQTSSLIHHCHYHLKLKVSRIELNCLNSWSQMLIWILLGIYCNNGNQKSIKASMRLFVYFKAAGL